MAPSRRKNTRSTNKNVLKNKKLEAFLKEFDREVQARKERILMECDSFLKEIDNMYSMEFLRLPAALQEMNWLEYMLGGGEKALEKAAMVDLDLLEVTKRATEALQAPVKTVWKAKKAKQAIETIEEEDGQPVLPVGKRSRQESDPPRASESSVQKLGKAKTTAKKARRSKRGRPPPARSTRLSRSVFKTPGLRAPAAQERVFSISVNGSPLAATDDVFITVPGGGGETICLRAGKLSRRDLMRLNPDTLGSVKKLSAQLASLCSTIRSTK
ncbi:PREDICTED: borealin isoform X2 [Gekko japonicus]|uniref:Borealin n=1 Tax=Gekko japonicus TaxID=146911 RepID=A0ABM1K9X3_GEKJA|nr:PREDICTED: borealin isoform X2 [Gekko japonicus]